MRIIIEGHKYRSELIAPVLHGIEALQDIEGGIVVNYVGYFYNPYIHDCVFFLPKVLLQDTPRGELVFGKYRPEDIIYLDRQSLLTQPEHDFIYEFSVWIYRTIAIFQQNNPANEIVYHKRIAQMGNGKRRLSNTFLDILLALVRFNEENQNFLMFTIKNLHSGHNKINWTRTIATTQALMQHGNPLYIHPINKKRKINFDEELLVIYYSILRHISRTYGFPVHVDVNFNLLSEKQMEHYLSGYGKTRLRQIKYKYFSDKALELWGYCYAFFEHSHQITVHQEQQEYLLVKDFYVVFEAIIDELIGDKDIPAGLKDQEDGKIVDHLYRYKSLTENDESKQIYYIGDSKYYKIGHAIGEESIAKQFTYARNVIQWNLNLFLDGGDTTGERKVRDDVTEGYNIIPNFFISAQLDENLSYTNDGITRTNRKRQSFTARQFENRLFDRDTLLVLHYDVNFLYIVSLYARNNAGQKKAWQHKVRELFRDEIRHELDARFKFYAMTAHADVEAEHYLRENFQMLLGKVYTPYEDNDYYAVALDTRPEYEEENEMVLSMLRQNFNLVECPLGTDPTKILPKVPRIERQAIPQRFLTMHWLENYQDANILVGCYKNADHLRWIQGLNDKHSLIYNVRLSKTRIGSLIRARILENKAVFVVLYPYEKDYTNTYIVYRIHHTAEMDEERMRKAMYPEPHGKYFCYVFDEEISLGSLDVKGLIAAKRLERDFIEGAPFFVKGSELIKYRK